MPRRAAAGRRGARADSWRKPGSVAVVTVFLLVASAAGLSRLGPLRDGRGPAHAALPAEPIPPPPKLSKEYVYAGGRLVAIEKPAAATYPAPTGLMASTYPATPTAVSVTWAGAAGAVDHYEVERKVSLADANPYSSARATTTTCVRTWVRRSAGWGCPCRSPPRRARGTR